MISLLRESVLALAAGALVASTPAAPAWLSLVSIPTGLIAIGGVLGLLIDGFGDAEPPAKFASWRDVGAVLGFAVGAVLYPIALVAVYG